MTATSVAVIKTVADAESCVSEWEGLFHDSGCPNPFAHPHWLLAWAAQFVQPGGLYIMLLRNDSQLVGVAPFYRRTIGIGGRAGATILQLLGAGHHAHLIELPSILARPDRRRSVFRSVFAHLVTDAPAWDWVEVTLAPEQGWFEPQWLPRAGADTSVAIHKSARPCVIVPLAPSWDETAAGFKRNVRESIRRGVNRLKRDDHSWRIAVPGDGTTTTGALTALTGMHGARAAVDGRPRHANSLADASDTAFIRTVAERMGPSDDFTPCLLLVDERPVAARLLLGAGNAVYFSISGFDPDWWDFGVSTTLLVECLKRSVASGRRSANLSTGIDVSKLRWSENVCTYNDFVVVNGRSRSRLAFSAYWQLRAGSLLRQARAFQGL